MTSPDRATHDGAPATVYERSPVDLLRVVVAAVAVVIMVVVELAAGAALASFLQELFSGVSAFPTWLTSTVVAAARLLAIALMIGGTVVAIVHRHGRLLGTAAAAVLAAVVLFNVLDLLFTSEGSPLAVANEVLGPVTNPDFPSATGLAVIAAAATAAAPWLSRRWRRVAWAAVVATGAARFLTAPVSLESLLALVVGWLAGSAVLLALGGPARRPGGAAVAAGLRAVGVPVASIHAADVDARGSTPYFGTTDDDRSVFVKVLGADERSADLMFRAYRRLVPHHLGDERAFSSLRRTVEHEALVALTARDLGVRTPHFLGLASAEPDAFVLAYEGIEGSSLDGVPADEFDDALLDAVWSQIALLRRHRVAHRDLRLANLFRGADGTVWIIDFGFSELAASDLLLATDLAELVASLSLVVGAERAVTAAVDGVGADALTSALPRMEPFALSGATRTAMKERPGLLDEVRSRVTATT